MILHAVIDAACVGSMSATLLWGVYCVGSIVRHIRARLTRERQRRERLEQIRQQEACWSRKKYIDSIFREANQDVFAPVKPQLYLVRQKEAE